MFPLPSELLSLSGEAAALLRDRRLVYANAAARSVLGEDCVGKDIRALFGSEIAETQAPSFAATATVALDNKPAVTEEVHVHGRTASSFPGSWER